jgi:hypothetical protein
MQVVKVEKQFLQALGERKKIIVQLHEKSNWNLLSAGSLIANMAKFEIFITVYSTCDTVYMYMLYRL